VFKYLLNTYENLVTTFKAIDYKFFNALEDYFTINVRASYYKLADYYTKLDKLLYYFIATLLYL
jgi:hypothetical protein